MFERGSADDVRQGFAVSFHYALPILESLLEDDLAARLIDCAVRLRCAESN